MSRHFWQATSVQNFRTFTVALSLFSDQNRLNLDQDHIQGQDQGHSQDLGHDPGHDQDPGQDPDLGLDRGQGHILHQDHPCPTGKAADLGHHLLLEDTEGQGRGQGQGVLHHLHCKLNYCLSR